MPSSPPPTYRRWADSLLGPPTRHTPLDGSEPADGGRHAPNTGHASQEPALRDPPLALSETTTDLGVIQPSFDPPQHPPLDRAQPCRLRRQHLFLRHWAMATGGLWRPRPST